MFLVGEGVLAGVEKIAMAVGAEAHHGNGVIPVVPQILVHQGKARLRIVHVARQAARGGEEHDEVVEIFRKSEGGEGEAPRCLIIRAAAERRRFRCAQHLGDGVAIGFAEPAIGLGKDLGEIVIPGKAMPVSADAAPVAPLRRRLRPCREPGGQRSSVDGDLRQRSIGFGHGFCLAAAMLRPEL